MTNSSPHAILLHPMVTEKTMRLMDENNSLEFLVRRSANKDQIKKAVEELFSCEVATVNTRITKDGKRAIVRFGGETSAEDIGMRIGVF
ncbi:MAG: 50S ribosomal protein L23 [Halobacteriales archaeon]|jgi:large subunit ribosomal protein L23|nr:50S ribosomal protein L23 [Halobacteriales archaeon]